MTPEECAQTQASCTVVCPMDDAWAACMASYDKPQTTTADYLVAAALAVACIVLAVKTGLVREWWQRCRFRTPYEADR